MSFGRIVLVLALTFTGCTTVQSAQFRGTALPPKIAPDFTLTDDADRPWTLSDQHGKTVALFFGYTHCADTCPTTLAKLAKAIETLGNRSGDAEIAFVTVDPERDTPNVLRHYIARFSGGKIVGLTGTTAQVRQVEHHYHVWAQKIPGVHKNVDDYDDAHSSSVYLIDRDGRERVVHDDDDSLQSFAADIGTLVR